MSTTTNHLTNLPNDVFTAITSDFDLAELCTLRLTSHNLHAIATTPSFQVRFHYIRTDLSRHSLQSLIALCSSSDLSHLIREITVLAKHYDDQELRQQLKDGKRWVAEAAPAPFFHSTGHSMSHGEKAEAQAMVDRMHQLREKQAAMQADSTDIKLLAEAFDHLGDRDVSLSIQAAVHTTLDGPRLPISKCRDKEAMTQIMDHTFKATIAALRQSRLQISNFSVYDMQWGGFVTLKGLHDAIAVQDTDAATLPAFTVPRPLHQVRTLTLDLHPAPVKEIGEKQAEPDDDRKTPVYGPDSPADLHEAYLASLATFLRPIAHGLQDLNIRFRGWHAISLDCAKVFGHIASSSTLFPSLTKFHVHNVIVQNTDLLALLHSMPHLTQLGLHKVSTPHDPSHPRKMVEYPNSHPAWRQMEPDVEGWKDAWQTVFDAFVVKNTEDGGELSPSLDIDANLLPPPCPRLEILELNALYLTSFEHRIYFTAPHSATSCYVHTIMDNETLKKQYWFKIQAFQEGLACCVFSGREVRGENTTTTKNDLASADEDIGKPLILENGLYVPLPPPPPKGPRGIHYKVSTTRPYGSPAYYQWLHFWQAREFGEMGCAPETPAPISQATTSAP